MSRSGYVDSYDFDTWEFVRWRGAVRSAIRGKRGQAFLLKMRDALDAMEPKRLLADVLVAPDGCCAMGSVAVQQDIDTSRVDPDDRDEVAKLFDIAPALAAEIAYLNDDDCRYSSPENRWKLLRNWVEEQLEEHDEDGEVPT